MSEYNDVFICYKGLMRPSRKYEGSLAEKYSESGLSQKEQNDAAVYRRMFYNQECEKCGTVGVLCVQGYYDEFNVKCCKACVDDHNAILE